MPRSDSEHPDGAGHLPVWLFGLVIFVSAFLLFQVQLVVAKVILPWFGGGAAVWATCMLFYQGMLLLGYQYADWSVRMLRPRTQALLHLGFLASALVVVAVSVLPLPGATGWKPADPGAPVLRIMVLLAATVGLPFFVLSATSPLLQAWHTRSSRQALPYRLFALSNLGSMLGLFSYPLAVEHLLTVRRQTQLWSAGFAVFAALCALIALRSRGGTSIAPGDSGDAPRPGLALKALWTSLAACASALLLVLTAFVTQDVAPIPFLWVLFLALYLASFIVCFSGEGRWYWRRIYLVLLVPALAGLAYLTTGGPFRLSVSIPAAAAGLFVACMACHGELARLKPHPRHLTSFYLMISLGGVLGGAFVALVAPLLFRGYHELPLSLALCALLASLVVCRDEAVRSLPRLPRLASYAAAAMFTAGLSAFLAGKVAADARSHRLMTRNFYGALRVNDWDADSPAIALREMVHGVVPHGTQFLAPQRRRQPTSYFGPDDGGGLALLRHRRESPQRVGVVGLGAGTLAAYGRPGDVYRMYEINPQVIDLARREFFYLADSPARIEVVAGDGRLSLEREAPQEFDILVIDVFSSDAIPVHMITREAFQLYFRHLKTDGVLAVNVTNGYLDPAPVLLRLARDLGRTAYKVSTAPDYANALWGSDWVLVSGNASFFAQPAVRGRLAAIAPRPEIPLWTDDYSNQFRIFK